MIKKTIFKKLIIITYSLNIISCSTLKNIIYQPTIIQGNFFTKKDLEKIHIGMKKYFILAILGTPTLHDPFGSNTDYYIFYKKIKHGKIIQNTLILKFDDNDNLISINHKKK